MVDMKGKELKYLTLSNQNGFSLIQRENETQIFQNLCLRGLTL